jgi:Zn-dependent protease
MEIDTEEVMHILVSVLAIALAMTLFTAPSLAALTGKHFIAAMIVFTIAIGSGFIFHELMHRYFARKFGAWAGYRAWTEGLVLMLILAVLPFFTGIHFLFLAPGAVYIVGRNITRQQNGIISVAGPVTNIVLAGIFFAAFALSCFFSPACSSLLSFLGTSSDIFSLFDALSLAEKIAYVGLIGFTVNMQLALFNMLPIPPLDGSKVLAWDWRVWLFVTAIPFVLTFLI